MISGSADCYQYVFNTSFFLLVWIGALLLNDVNIPTMYSKMVKYYKF